MFLMFVLFACAYSQENSPWSPAIQGGFDGKLLQVHVVYRNGHREPESFYPYDPHASFPIWKDGPTQLTILGRQQGFRLGQQLQSRYQTLLPTERAWQVVKATSSDTSRTIMTSAVVLAGLLPPSAEDKWSNITWQPVPIHTSPSNIDNVLGSHPYCDEYNHLHEALANEKDDEKRILYYLLTKYTGDKINSPNALIDLYTCLEIESQAGLKLPKWTRPVYHAMRTHAWRALLRSTRTPKITRLRSGPLLSKLTNYEKEKSTYNIHLYCTHDVVLSGLIGSLGFELSEPPSFTSAVIMEFRECSGEIHVQFWYRKGPDNGLYRLQHPGCGIRCPLNKLKRLVEPLIPRDWTKDCTIVEYTRDFGFELRFVFAIIFVIVLIGWCLISKYTKDYEVYL